MDIRLAAGRIYRLHPALDFAQAQQQAIDKRSNVVAGGLGALLSRPKPEEVDLVYAETRYEPIWHVVCTVRFAFDRNREFSVPVTGPEVQRVTLFDREFAVAVSQAAQPGLLQQLGLGGAARSVNVPGVEHCLDENRQERIVDAVTGQPASLAVEALAGEKTEVTDLTELASGDALIVPPQIPATQIVKSLFAMMIKEIQADKVMEETAHVERLDLLFRPIYAFEFNWKPKNKTGVAEVDALSGAMGSGEALHARSDRPLSREAVFDITPDNVTTLMPNAAISARLVTP